MSLCWRNSSLARVRWDSDLAIRPPMPLPLTKREKLILTIIAGLIVLGLIGMAVL